MVGPDVPIAVTLDFHGNLSDTMVREADLLHGYKTYPHVDMGERGVEATEQLIDVIGRRVRPTARLAQAAAPASPRQPGHEPRADATALRHGRRDGKDPEGDLHLHLRRLSLADIPDAGFGIYVVTDGDQALADRLADRLADTAWTHRHEFIHTALPVREAVAKALAADGQPIVLADMADNTGGGAAG